MRVEVSACGERQSKYSVRSRQSKYGSRQLAFDCNIAFVSEGVWYVCWELN